MITIEYHPLIIIKNQKGRFLQTDINAQLEKVIFQISNVYPSIVEIYPENNGKKFLYSELDRKTILLTAFLDSDFDGIITPRRSLIKTEIENVSNPEEIQRRHLERISDRMLYEKRDIIDHACEAYSRLIRESKPLFPLSIDA